MKTPYVIPEASVLDMVAGCPLCQSVGTEPVEEYNDIFGGE